MEYNTTRNHLVIREYGRHIQKMVDHILTIEDRERRQRQAQVVIELMGVLNPHLKNVEDFRHKLWDHLFLISDFKLDVDSPYPIPTAEKLRRKPDPLSYPKRYPKYSHLGKNLELVITKALDEENPEKRQGFANAIAYYMKLAYNNWHKDQVHDDAIQQELTNLTKGQLEFTTTPFVKAYRASQDRDLERPSYNNGGRQQRGKFQQRSGTGGSGGGNGGGGGRGPGGNGGGGRNDKRSGGPKYGKKRF
ncbi:MAG TPA: DUF4290 domain-containing protein [Flavisolibacter sp.]|nr:DUF4290 domain-containing protein [Flavisolibacter sp.]